MSDPVTRNSFDRFMDGVSWLSMQSGWLAGSLAVVMMAALVREVGRPLLLQRAHRLGGGLERLPAGGHGLPGLGLHHLHRRPRAGRFLLRPLHRPPPRPSWICSSTRCASTTRPSCSGRAGGWPGSRWFTDEVSSGGVRWPLFPFQVLVPLGSGLVILLLVVRMLCNLRYLRGKGEPYSQEKGGH